MNHSDIYIVSFFGHRSLYLYEEIERKMEKVISDLIYYKKHVKFLVGRDGEFDRLTSSVVRRLVKKYDSGNISHVLVLPYMRAEYRDNQENFLTYYDEVEICEESCQAHFKSAIQIRNRIMVDRSDLIVCCIQNQTGGAYKTIQYAESQNKRIINLAERKL
ncbi:MAG: hypothetical protein K2O42_11105 [Oscillospiraceae bacterium]|nr:hypothetical protein [Oscillospiraceae bacterium]